MLMTGGADGKSDRFWEKSAIRSVADIITKRRGLSNPKTKENKE